MRRALASAVALLALVASQAAEAQQRDPANPTCPLNPNWATYPEMRFSMQRVNGHDVMLAEGAIDDNMLPRLQAFLQSHNPEEIWLRSPGGNARVGNQAGTLIRESGFVTRIPAGWACFSACNFVFMGGMARFVDNGGLFIVHMFTFTSDPTVRREVSRGADSSIGVIGDVEQQSALLASEDNDFLIRMGVSRHLLTDVMYQQRAIQDAQNHSTRRCLTQDEVNRYNVVTSPWTGSTPATPTPTPARTRR